jgi:hypothetical protein
MDRWKSKGGKSQRRESKKKIGEEKARRKKIGEEKESEERRCRCAKTTKTRETLCFSNDLWLWRVAK